MPSAVKQSTPSPGEEPNVNHVCTIVEKKIRNLEKRKQRLDGYKEEQNRGKKLDPGQLEAITHLADVEQQIDSARELLKQVTQFAQEYNRHMKLKKKQDLKDRTQAEQAKIRELIQIQEILNLFGTEEVRAAFQNGSDGAIRLSEPELLILDGVYTLVSPARDRAAQAGKSFAQALDEAAQHGHALVAGSPKQVDVNGALTTYKELKKLLTTIMQCKYFAAPPDSRSVSPEGNQGESSASSTYESAPTEHPPPSAPAGGVPTTEGGDPEVPEQQQQQPLPPRNEAYDAAVPAAGDHARVDNGEDAALPPVENGLGGVTFGSFQQPTVPNVPDPDPSDVGTGPELLGVSAQDPSFAHPGQDAPGYDTASSEHHQHDAGGENFCQNSNTLMYSNAGDGQIPQPDYHRQPLAAQQPSHDEFGGTFSAGDPQDDNSFKSRGGGGGRVFHSGGRRPRGPGARGGYRGGFPRGGGGNYDGGAYQNPQGAGYQGPRGGGYRGSDRGYNGYRGGGGFRGQPRAGY